MTSTAWSRRTKSDHEWDLLADGRLAGEISFVPDSGLSHARHADIVLAALNAPSVEELVVLAPPDAPYRNAGWLGFAEYQQQIKVVKDFVAQFDTGARDEVAAAWHRAEFPHPMTRTQMTDWQDTVLSVLTAYRAQEEPAA